MGNHSEVISNLVKYFKAVEIKFSAHFKLNKSIVSILLQKEHTQFRHT
jgi:hypothetical protein